MRVPKILLLFRLLFSSLLLLFHEIISIVETPGKNVELWNIVLKLLSKFRL